MESLSNATDLEMRLYIKRYSHRRSQSEQGPYSPPDIPSCHRMHYCSTALSGATVDFKGNYAVSTGVTLSLLKSRHEQEENEGQWGNRF